MTRDDLGTLSFLDDERLYQGADGEDERAARRALLARLLAAGVSQARMIEAVEEDRLAVLPAELVLGGDTPYTLTDVARQVGIRPPYLRQLLLALGRPNPARGQRAFTDADVEEARILKAFIDAGLPREGIVHVARVLGHSMNNAAVAIQDLVGGAFIKRGDSEHDLALRYEQAAEQLSPLVGPLLGHELLVHLREMVRRAAVSQAEREAGTIRGTQTVAVGFGDLVGFTKLGSEVPPEQLGTVADRLADMAVRASRPPVQLVKTIGDAVMLVAPEVPPLLKALRGIAAAAEKEDEFPALRAGIAYGDAVSRAGDWFGAPVNLASRLTDAAKPGMVFVDEAAKGALGDNYDWSRPKRKSLKGIGRTKYFRLDAVPGD